MTAESTRILIADDHPLFRVALRSVLDSVFDACAVTEVRTYAEALAAVAAGPSFDIAFVDLVMPGVRDPFEELSALRASAPETPLVVISSRGDRITMRSVLALGVSGFVPKTTPKPEIERAIRVVLSGHAYVPDLGSARPTRATGDDREPLSPRQTDVLQRLAHGRSNRQIAEDLQINEITVKAHISAILRKLRVKSRLEAVVISREMIG